MDREKDVGKWHFSINKKVGIGLITAAIIAMGGCTYVAIEVVSTIVNDAGEVMDKSMRSLGSTLSAPIPDEDRIEAQTISYSQGDFLEIKTIEFQQNNTFNNLNLNIQ